MRLKLIYSHKAIKEPILSDIILETGVPINILQAKINDKKGELVISVSLKEQQCKEVISMFQSKGIQVEPLTETLSIDYDICISCGACISPCPTKALGFKPDWTIELNEELCIVCEICSKTCPVKAISLP